MKLIDLTHVIDPSTVQRKFSIETIGAETVNHNVVRSEGQWYIMTNISMVSHIGTHIEVPYHILPEGEDLATVPLETFCGDAVLLDLSAAKGRTEISKEMLQQAADKAGEIRAGDIVFCRFGCDSLYGTEAYGQCPYFSEQAIQWLCDSRIKMMGVDLGGVEIPASEQHVNHTNLFRHRIPLIENLAHLDQLPQPRFQVSAFPYPVVGVEAFPVRVVAGV